MGLMGLVVACCGGLYGILTGLARPTDHPSIPGMAMVPYVLHVPLKKSIGSGFPITDRLVMFAPSSKVYTPKR